MFLCGSRILLTCFTLWCKHENHPFYHHLFFKILAKLNEELLIIKSHILKQSCVVFTTISIHQSSTSVPPNTPRPLLVLVLQIFSCPRRSPQTHPTRPISSASLRCHRNICDQGVSSWSNLWWLWYNFQHIHPPQSRILISSLLCFTLWSKHGIFQMSYTSLLLTNMKIYRIYPLLLYLKRHFFAFQSG